MARSNRTLALTIAGLVAAIAVVFTAALLFLSSAAGRAFVTARALPILSRAIDQDVSIRDTSGDWPNEIIFTGVKVSDPKGTWLEINRLRLVWHPFVLLSGRVNIDALQIDEAHFLRLPEARTPPPTAPSVPLDLQALQDTLDPIRVDELSINTLRVEPKVFGNAAAINVKAALKPAAGAPVLNIALERRDAPGTATLTFQWGDGDLALKAKAAIGGVNLDSDLALRGPTQTLSGTVHGSCGGAGFCVKWSTGQLGSLTADATLAGTRAAPVADISFHLTDLRESGRSLNVFDGVVSLKPDIAAKTLRLEGRGSAGGLKKALPEAAAVLADAGTWSVAGNMKGNTTVLDTFTLTAGDSEAVLTGLLIGSNLSGAGLYLNVKGAGRLADIKDTTSRTHAELKVTQAALAGPLTASGTLALTIENLPAGVIPSPAFSAPLKINAAITLSAERLNIGDAIAAWGPAAFKGESTLARNTVGFDHLSTTGNLVIAPNAFESQTKPIQIDTKLRGGFAVLNAALTASLDEYQRGAAKLTSIKTTVQAQRSSAGWQGDLRTEAALNDAPITFTSAVTRSVAETLISGIHLEGAGADLKGDVRLNKAGKAATGTLSGPVNDLVPWTLLAGFPVKGQGDVKFALSGDAQQRLDATLDANAISSSVLGAEYLKLTVAVGDLFGAVKVKADLRATEGDIANRRFDQLTASVDGSLKLMKVALQAKGTRLRRFTVDLGGNHCG